MWKAECAIDANRKYKGYILLSLALPILVASIRGGDVGADMPAYVIPWHESALKIDSFLKFCKFNVDSKEYLYYAIVYYPTKIFGFLFPILLLQQILITIGVIRSLLYFKRKYRLQFTYAYTLYLFFYYNESLCIMRQSIAISFGLLALIALLENRIRQYSFFTVIAFFFHNSILSFSVTCFAFYLINKKINKRGLKVLAYSFILLTLTSLSFITNVIISLNVNERFVERLVDGDQNQGGYMTISLYAFFVFVPFILKYMFRKNVYIDFLWLLPVVGFIFVVLAKQSMYFGRMAYPFLCCLIFTLPKSLRANIVLKYTILLLVISYWYYVNGISDTWGTYNYMLDSNFNF